MRSKILTINRKKKKISIESIVILRPIQKLYRSNANFVNWKVVKKFYRQNARSTFWEVKRSQGVHKELISSYRDVISITTCVQFFKFVNKILCNDKQMLTHLITVCFILLVILYFLPWRFFSPRFVSPLATFHWHIATRTLF